MKKIMILMTGMVLSMNLAMATSVINKEYTCESDSMLVNIYTNGTATVDLGDGDLWKLERYSFSGDNGNARLYQDGGNAASLIFVKAHKNSRVMFKLVEFESTAEGGVSQRIVEDRAFCR